MSQKAATMTNKSTAVFLAAFCAFFLASLHVHAGHTPRRAVNDPPFFLNTPPDTIIVPCRDSIPLGQKLEADDDEGAPNFPVLISPVDTPIADSINGCAGGQILRTWTAVDSDGDTTRFTQVIIILPDTDPPFTTAATVNDTLPCEAINYPAWVASTRLAFLSNTGDNCSSIGNGLHFSDDAPPMRPPGCGTLVVTFTARDACNNTLTWQARLTARDTVRPVLVGIPPTDTVDCGQPLPPPPLVTATDNCPGSVDIVFTEVNNRAVDPSVCGHYQYQVTRTWRATDACGNSAVASQIIRVLDLNAPNFDRPADVQLLCNQNPLDLSLTGNISNISDNCSTPFVVTSFNDIRVPGSCSGNYTIQRQWLARDVCNNSTVKFQTITVRDTTAPVFTVPADLTISCDQDFAPAFTGEPANITDNCQASGFFVTPVDVIVPGSCVYGYTIRRNWEVRDSCGNVATQLQIIQVVDQTAPVVQTEASDREVLCSIADDYQAAFSQWIANRGGAAAADNCTFVNDLVWTAFNAGTNDPASLPAPVCPTPDSIVLEREVWFVVSDECGNRDTTRAVFRVIDIEAPVFLECSPYLVFPTDPGQCEANISLAPPRISDDCGFGVISGSVFDQQPITTNAAPGLEGITPVNPVQLNIPLVLPQPISAAGPATLTVQLFNADAEGATEYFIVYGENGDSLGRTGQAPVQCSNSTATFTLSPAQLESWAADGVVRIRLVPNIPSNQSGAFAVNAICPPGSSARATLNYAIRNLTGLQYEYSVDGGPRQPINLPNPIALTLTQGGHSITYYATDCAGNESSCQQIVEIQDQEAPDLPCPADIIVPAAPGTCAATVALPFPVNATDNCAVGRAYFQNQPSNTNAAFLTFEYDPNLNEYVAQPKNYTFTGVAANATDDAVLRIVARGDFNTNGAFLRIRGENNTLIGATTVGFADCSDASIVQFTIPKAIFNAWAADGSIAIRVEPNPILVPPGVPGDGVNPCDPSEVEFDGDTDGVSYVFVALEYNALEDVRYFAEGATALPLANFPAPPQSVEHEFSVGETRVFYIIQDRAGNPDTCSYRIIVQDTQAPVALCQPTTVFVNPSGVSDQVIDPALIDAGSSDNCGIANRVLSPAMFSCQQAGNTFPMTLTVTDLSGNTASCSTLVRVEMERPQPSANSGICGGDTLFLFANPPVAQGGIIYTYQWSGPGGFTSNQENPVIPNISPARAGSYAVTITGITGCTASGSVEVVIENLPLVPVLQSNVSICTNNDIVLTSGVTVSSPNAIYRWYEGLPPSGVLLATTNSPQLILPGPHAVGQRTFYLILESGPCVTAPSVPVTVSIFAIPVAVVNQPQVTICQGQPLQLATNVTGPGMTYQWVGPSFMSSNQSPLVTNSAGPGTGGIYTLRVTQNGCTSAPDTTVVTVLPKPATPLLGSSGPACEGGNILLTASTPASLYHWLPPGGGPAIVTTANVLLLQNVNTTVAGPWRVFVTQFGCNSDISAPLQVVVNPIPQVTAEAVSTSICEGQALQLIASPVLVNAQYIWSGPAGFSSGQRAPAVAPMTPNRAGVYTVTVTTAEGCSASGSISVEVIERPTIIGVSNNAPSCIAGPADVLLSATVSPPDNGTYTYTWSGPCSVMAPGSNATIPGANISCNGLYQLVVSNAQGCPSLPATTFVNLSSAPATPAIPVITSGNAGAICAGQPLTLSTTTYSGTTVTYYWQTPAGLIPTSTPSLAIPSTLLSDSGPYSVFVEVDGCTSSVSGQINVVISPVPSIAGSSNSPVCEGQNILLNATFIPGATYQWTGLSNGFSSSLNNPTIPNADSTLHTGRYVVVATRNGCMSRPDTVNVLVRTRPVRPVIVQPIAPVCISRVGAQVVFAVTPASATPGAAYDWFDQNNVQIGVSAGTTFTFNNFAPYGEGTFQFFVRARKDGCTSALSEPVLVTFNTIPAQPAFAGVDTTVCPNGDIFLNATAPPRGTGLWSLAQGGSGGEVIVSPAQARSQVTGLQMGNSYTFQWTLSNGACTNYASDSVVITVREIEMARAGNDTVICPGTPFQLYAAPVLLDVGQWSQPSVQAQFGVQIVEPDNPASEVTGLASGNLYLFIWTLSGVCGSRSDSVFVTVSDVRPSAGPDFRACNDEQFAVLRAQSPGTGSTGSWSSPDTALTFSNRMDPNATVTGLKPGRNVLVWTINDALCGGASIDTVFVEYTPNPVAERDTFAVVFGEPTLLYVLVNDYLPSGPNTLRVISAPQFGSATALGDSVIVYTPDINFFGEDRLSYEICSDGCECSMTTVIIRVSTGDRCNVPSVITPNGDKINDALVIPCLFDLTAYPYSQVLVFNRWGDEVFRSSIPYRNNWEGTYNGQDLPPGTYFYVINYGDGSVPRRGFLMILR